MMVKILNLTSSPVWLTLSSGQPLRLAPGETSAELGDVEVKNNAKVEELQEQRVIALLQEEERAISAPAESEGLAETPAHAEAAESTEVPARSRKKS